MSDPLKTKQEFFAINALRFGAAFWVLVFHSSIHLGNLAPLGLIQPLINQGPLAMTLFFMLSGFVLSYRYQAFGSQSEVRLYTAARIARLYPVYLFMGLITLWRVPSGAGGFALYTEYGWIGKIVFLLALGALFLLALQAWFPAFFDKAVWNFGGSWSLSVEAFFYSLFPWLRNRLGRFSAQGLALLIGALVIVMAAIMAGMLAATPKEQQPSSIFYVLPIFRLPEFILGIGAFVLFVEKAACRKWLYGAGVVLGMLLLLAMWWRDLPGLIDYGWLAAIPFLAMFVAGTALDAPEIIKAVINYCGRVSYCVYMSQFTTIPIIKRFRSDLSIGEAWLLSIGGTLLLAILTYHFVEVLAYRRTRQFSLLLEEKLASYMSRGNLR